MKTPWACPRFVPAPPGSRPHPHPAARPAACLGMLKGWRARRQAYTGHPKRASRRDESKTSFTFTETAWRQLQLRMRTLVLPIATAAMMRLPAFSRIWARCRFAHSCCRVLLAQARSWSDSSWSDGLVTGRHPVFLPLGVYGDSASRPAPRKGPIVHVARPDRVRAGRRFVVVVAWAP